MGIPIKLDDSNVTEANPEADLSKGRDDAHLVKLWLFGKSYNTRDAYSRDVEQFVQFAGFPLSALTLDDLQSWASHLHEEGYSVASRARKLAAIKSLIAFGHKIGYLKYNVGAVLLMPKVRSRLSERILSEQDVQRLLLHESNLRNSVLLLVFYASGGRVSELSCIYWRAVQERTTSSAGQMVFDGKGEKTRSVLLSANTWEKLMDLNEHERNQGFGKPDDPVFRSPITGGPLSRSQLWRIVRRAANKAGLKKNVSPHWLRHAHASHALDRGAPPHLVMETLGHNSLATTSRYTHARPDDSSSRYLIV